MTMVRNYNNFGVRPQVKWLEKSVKLVDDSQLVFLSTSKNSSNPYLIKFSNPANNKLTMHNTN